VERGKSLSSADPRRLRRLRRGRTRASGGDAMTVRDVVFHAGPGGVVVAEPTSHATIARMKRIVLWSLALLWLLDAALQAQPRMFTLDFISNIMIPSIAISPSVLGSVSDWAVQLVTPNIAEWNWMFTGVQFAIALCLIGGLSRKNDALIRSGLIVSILWGLGVWVVGEGTSGVFTGTGTLLTGAPGAVLLYVLLAVFCLLPDSWWNLRARFCLPRDALALTFLYGAIAQVLTQPFWGEQGIPALLQGQTAMAASWMVSTMSPAVHLTSYLPALWNAGFAAVMLAISACMFGRHPRVIGFALLGVTLLVVWYWGQAFGGIFSGMGTDPNTPPLLAVMAIPAWTVFREHAWRAVNQAATGRRWPRTPKHADSAAERSRSRPRAL